MLKCSTKEDRTITLNFRMLERILRFVAVWPTDYNPYLPVQLRGRYFLSHLLDALYLLFWLCICLHIATFHVITVTTVPVSYDELFLALITTSIYSIMAAMYGYLRLHERKVRQLREYSDRLFRQRSAPGVYYLSISSCYRFANRCLGWWLIFCILGTMHWAIYPILSQNGQLPFPCWYPVDVQRSPLYELAYMCQVLGQLQVSLVYGLAGALFMVYVFIACNQFDMLSCSLVNVRHTAMLLNGGYGTELRQAQAHCTVDLRDYFLQEAFLEDLDRVATEEEIVFYDPHRRPTGNLLPTAGQHYLAELSGELTVALGDCVRHHLVLREFCELLEDCYHPYVLLKLFQILLLLCFLAFMATVESLSTMKLINVLEYFMLTMTELYLYCFLGQILKNQGLKVGDALWKSPWQLCGASYRRRMLIILMNAQRPVRLTGLKLYELNLQTYYTVLRAAFSYYTIIKKFR
ncbi:odorant receptor 83a-like [Anopheles albimanus]|uniref:odorant receptor 83a-like n=1 Tax=Anopheles albimanus TaxID=7167 RepID=UPI0016420B99|nr:odorant receptor 83a-like [Anopheles albimanus]